MVILEFGDLLSSISPTKIEETTVTLNDTHGFYEPPLDLAKLLMLGYANPVHGSLPSFTTNMALKYFKPNPIISRKTLQKISIDFKTTGNAYCQLLFDNNRSVIEIKHLPAINMRRKPKGYCWLNDDDTVKNFKIDEVFHFIDYSPTQNIYGIPYWYGAIQSILLGEEARLFPRKFFQNGAHMGSLILTSGLNPEQEQNFIEKITKTKSNGNFKSVYANFPNGDLDKVVKVIPMGSIDGEINFPAFSKISDEDTLRAWRVRPELAGIITSNTHSGDLDKIIKMYYTNETLPYIQELTEINSVLPEQYHLQFNEFEKE